MRPSDLIFTLAQNRFVRVNAMQEQLKLLHCDISSFVMLQCSYNETQISRSGITRIRVANPASTRKADAHDQ
jgi:hypothetical protein